MEGGAALAETSESSILIPPEPPYKQFWTSNPEKAVTIFLEWEGLTRAQGTIKEILFIQCSQSQSILNRLQEFNNLTQFGQLILKLNFLWAKLLRLISVYFNIPLFELARGKLQTILQNENTDEATAKTHRKIGALNFEHAYFCQQTHQLPSPLELREQGKTHFEKSLALRPSYKTHVKWGIAAMKFCKLSQTFSEASEHTKECNLHFTRATELKPNKTNHFHLWASHLDWLLTFFISCRQIPTIEQQLIDCFTPFIITFEKISRTTFVSAQCLLAFGFVEFPPIIPRLSKELLQAILQTSQNEEMRQEAQRHINTLEEMSIVMKAQNNDKLVKAHSLFQQLTPEMLSRVKRSTLTAEDVAPHLEIFINCLFFLTEDTNHPFFKTSKRRAHGTYEAKNKVGPFTEAELKTIFSHKNPATIYHDPCPIGKGAFGRVYAVSCDNETMAMKVFREPFKNEFGNAVIKEIKFLRECRHKNFVSFHEAFFWQGEISVVMDFVDGGSLKESCGIVRLASSEIGYFCKEICEGLRFIHSKNFVHRDIKCENILLSLDGHVRIADLGLMEHTSGSGKDSLSMVGTSYWMPPEIIKQMPYGEKVDIWGLGCVAHELATGQAPYADFGSLACMYYTSTIGAPCFIKNPEDQTKQEIEKGAHSEVFCAFLDACFQANPDFRPSSEDLIHHSFFESRATWGDSFRRKMRFLYINASLRKSGLI